jgi:hypothetical protein
MPRVSMKKEDMMGVGFFKEGNVEIVKAVCAAYQFPPNSKTGVQSDPFPAVVLSFVQLAEDWSRPDDAETQDLAIRIGSFDKIRPGNLSDPNDLEADPEDLGDEVGTEGNSIYGDDGARLGFNWPAFVESLKKAGFKPNIIDRIYMPDYKGMKCHLKQVATGSKYTAKDGVEKDSMTWLCTEIQTFPYEKKSAGKTASKTTTAVKGGVKAAEVNPQDVVMALLADPSDQFKKMVPGEKAIKRQVFQLQISQELIRKKVQPVSVHSQVSAWLKEDENLQALANDVGFVVDFDAGTVMFA